MGRRQAATHVGHPAKAAAASGLRTADYLAHTPPPPVVRFHSQTAEQASARRNRQFSPHPRANGKRSLRRGGDEREAEDTSLQGTRGYEHNGNHKKTGSPLTRQIGAGLAGSGGTEWRQPGCAPEIESRLRKRGRRQVRVPATAAQGRPATARRAQCVTPDRKSVV